jgi:hypothetical protein
VGPAARWLIQEAPPDGSAMANYGESTYLDRSFSFRYSRTSQPHDPAPQDFDSQTSENLSNNVDENRSREIKRLGSRE